MKTLLPGNFEGKAAALKLNISHTTLKLWYAGYNTPASHQ
jgi:hypothetical protein